MKLYFTLAYPPSRLFRTYLLLLFIWVVSVNAFGQIGIKPDVMYEQNFDLLTTTTPNSFVVDNNKVTETVNTSIWADNTTLPGWYCSMTKSDTRPLPYSSCSYGAIKISKNNYTANNGILGMGMHASTGNELALGSFTAHASSNVITGSIYYGIRFKNISNTHNITSINLSFVLEQWLDADEHSSLTLEYLIAPIGTELTDVKNGTWIPVGAADFLLAPKDLVGNSSNGDLIAMDGNSASNRVSKNISIPDIGSSSFQLAPGQEIMIRWVDFDAGNNAGKKDILAIDDLEVTPTGSLATPLPVVLTSFQAQHKNGAVELSWATASEKDNEYFEVQRSLDAKSFEAIGRVAGNGTSNVRQFYTYTDATAVEGATYYRLKQVDNDGKFEYSKVIHQLVKKPATAAKVSVALNPFYQKLTYSIENAPKGELTVAIRNSQGRSFYQEKRSAGASNTAVTVPTSALPPGLYILSVTGPGLNLTERVMKIE